MILILEYFINETSLSSRCLLSGATQHSFLLNKKKLPSIAAAHCNPTPVTHVAGSYPARGAALHPMPGGPYNTSAGPRPGVLNVHIVPHTHVCCGRDMHAC